MVRLHERSAHPGVNLGPTEEAYDNFNDGLDCRPDLLDFLGFHMHVFLWFSNAQVRESFLESHAHASSRARTRSYLTSRTVFVNTITIMYNQG